MKFEKQVILLNEPKSRDFFPEKFGNEIYMSTIGNAEPIIYQSCFSIKYALKGEETYVVNGKFEKIKEDQVLVVNDESEVVSLTKPKKGIALSIFLEKEIFLDILTNQKYTANKLIDMGNSIEGSSYEFSTDIIQDESGFKQLIRGLASEITKDLDKELSQEVFYDLAYSLIQTQVETNRGVGKIAALRMATRKEIYKRVNQAKNYIEENIHQKFDLALLSKQAALSPFHLIRCFRHVYQITPHQYYKMKRIEKSKELLLKGLQVNEVSRCMGYPDIYSFSKQFKQVCKIAPSYFKDSI